MAHDNIILIGPIGAGKTTIGELLSKKLNRQWVQVDEIRFNYYHEIGYDDEVARERRAVSIAAIIDYWKPFEVHAVERILAEYENCVIDFGAGHSVYEDPALLDRARRALAPFPNVILLLPSPDADESLAVLAERLNEEEMQVKDALMQLNQHFLSHPSNNELAKITVYTKGKQPEETCDEIIGKLSP